MTNIEMILKLMEPELNDIQLKKLNNVLQIILKPSRNALPNEELLERFIQHKKLVGMKDTSTVQYVIEIRHVMKYNPDKNLTELTTADLKAYLAAYVRDHGIQANTLQTRIRCISSFYEFLVNEEFIERNPCNKIERVMVEKKIKKAFTYEEIDKIREACTSVRDRAIVEFLYSTGARISEAINLYVRDIDFDSSEVIVFGKGHKERIVYLSNIASKYLKEYLDSRENLTPDRPLFPAYIKGGKESKNRITSRAVELLLKDIGERAGVQNVHPHRFRRSMATHALDKGMPIEQIKELLGHSRLDTTMIYCNVNRAKVKANFNEYFNGNSNEESDDDE